MINFTEGPSKEAVEAHWRSNGNAKMEEDIPSFVSRLAPQPAKVRYESVSSKTLRTSTSGGGFFRRSSKSRATWTLKKERLFKSLYLNLKILSAKESTSL